MQYQKWGRKSKIESYKINLIYAKRDGNAAHRGRAQDQYCSTVILKQWDAIP